MLDLGVTMNESQTVFITGASGGIGKEVVLKFAAEGWDILCHYCSSDAFITELGGIITGDLKRSFKAFKADFTKEDEVNNLVAKISKFKIDSFINNAGGYIEPVHYSELNYQKLIKTFSLNAFAPMMIMTEIFKGMKSRNFGRIVNVGSIASKYGGSPNSMDYGSAKASMESVVKIFAREGASSNVLVNTVRLGVIDTDAHKKFPKDMSKRVELIPMKRMGTAKEVSEVLYFLGSNKNTYITNEVITAAGGE